jgi:lipopolysaccharide export system protein LptA
MNLPTTRLLPILVLLAVLVADQAHAAPAQRKVPTNIQSDSMEYNAVAQTVIFSGNVHVTRPDFEVWSKKLTVYLKKSGNADAASSGADSMRAGDIDRLVAEGDVRIKSDNKSGECQTLTYYADTEKVVMEGSPVLRDPDSTIRGTVITHYMQTNRSHVGGRVNATFEAPDKTGSGLESDTKNSSGNGDTQ